MNKFRIPFLLSIFLLNFSLLLHSQKLRTLPGYEKELNEKVLVARKEQREYYFRTGNPVQVSVSGYKKPIRGFITDFSDSTLTIEAFQKGMNDSWQIIPDQIDRIRLLSRLQRKKAVLALGGALVYSGAMLLAIKETGPLTYVLFLPAFAVAGTFLFYYPATFLYDLMNEKKAASGWGFGIVHR